MRVTLKLYASLSDFLPDEAKRKVWARSLIGGSIVLAIIINQIKH